MKHPSTQAVFHYWNMQRGARPAPLRSDIEPFAIRHALGDTFMLSADFTEQLRFRLAGTRVCALFCRELKGEAFSALWSEASRQTVGQLLAIISDESVSAVAGLRGHTDDGEYVELELLLLPLLRTGHARTRALGTLVPATRPYWLGAKPLTGLDLTTLRHLDENIDRHLETPALQGPAGGTVRHGFVVYSGGRETPSGERAG